ncbi:DNA repair protein RAD16 [Ceratocystis pirilliformis]|uniref:DNA repair protein RAD16 n=1 Tax=Ceratocystis pirilliformis TaxID=259994 RepID=A0ABR3Z2G0_9PEZI
MASNSGPQTTGPVQPVKLSLPLKFQQEIFQEVRAEDELVIMARGLGLLRLVANLLHSYDAAGNNLILLMGADEREATWLGRSLIEHKIASSATKARGLTCVDSKETPKTRQEMYARGGLFSVTARILIGDMLSGVVQAENVTGIVALHAQKFTATSNEAFILRVWRGKNRSGFLKAFSDKPEAFIRGFSQLTKMLGSLFLRKVSLWPRYHVTVASSLEGKRRAEVIELEVPMTGAMLDIQNAIKECVEQCVQEIRKTNTGLDLEEWDARTVMLQNFDVMIRRQLEPNWHRISNKTRRIVADLTVLRALLQYVLEYDAVAFLEHLDYIHATYAPDPGSLRNTESPWMFLDAAQTIFESAQKRVYAAERHSARHEDDIDALWPVLEELPKWAILAEVLDEIDRDIQTSGPSRDDSSGCILIMCQSSATCRQLRDYLQTMHLRPQDTETGLKGADNAPAVDQEYTSASYLMRRKLRTYLRRKREFSVRKALLYADTQRSLNKAVDLTTGQGRGTRGVARGGSTASKRRRVRGGGVVGSNPSRTENGAVAPFTETPAQVAGLINSIGEAQAQNADVEQRVDLVQDEFDDMEQQYGLLSLHDLLVIRAYDGDGDDTMLEQVKPRYIVMYDVEAAFIRRIEVYRSSHNDRDVRSYFMYYADSVEEERYLSAVRREKDAFTQLIRERASMTLTLDVPKDGRTSEEDRFLSRISTRIAGGGKLGPGAARKIPPRVIVDIREFRSSLPPLLHGHGMDVVPCQLTVGDYILSPRICVERKAISDLIQSLNSGRLWTQCEAMFRHYACPLLLIEFDHNKSFTLERFADMGSGGGSFGSSATVGSDLQGKIVALTLAFPRLRIIWSSSPYETAEIFQSLKSQESEPDPRAAVEAGLTTGEKEAGDGHLEPTLQAMMAAIPGVTPANMAALTCKARNIKELANTRREDLVKIVGPENAGKIDYFFSRNLAH